MRISYLAVAGLVSLANVTPVLAQSADPIATPADMPWKHSQTGIILPAAVIGLPRDKLAQNGNTQIDVIADYRVDESAAVTIFVFRPAIQSVPIWFDRAEAQILLRDVYGHATPATAITPFAPPRTATTSALRRTYLPNAGPFKSTSLAVLPMGEWLVAIRISSRNPDAAALDAKLDELIKSLGWPDKMAEAPIAVPIGACATPLVFAKNAKMTTPDMSDAILGAALASVVATKEKETQIKPVTWCREGAETSPYGTYRNDAGGGGYLMAMGDAGRVIQVTPTIPLTSKKPGYRVSVGLLDQTLIYPSFDKLPAPDAAFEAVKTTNPVTSITRDGKDITMTVDSAKNK